MRLTYKEVEDVLFVRYGLPLDRLVAFRGRLQHLQRSGFPQGVNTGKGKRAHYGWDQLLELSTVLDLIDLGLPPDAASKLLSAHRDDLLQGFAGIVVQQERDELLRQVDEQVSPFATSILMRITGHALTNQTNDVSNVVSFLEGSTFLANQSEDDNPYAPLAEIVIDVSKRLLVVMDMLVMRHQHEPDELVDSLIKWAYNILTAFSEQIETDD